MGIWVEWVYVSSKFMSLTDSVTNDVYLMGICLMLELSLLQLLCGFHIDRD